MQALTLRAAARAAGVSHAAPAHHFGDLTGLLSELAAEGYRRFDAALGAALDAAGSTPRAGMQAMGQAYVRFARDHPGMFTLMFRSDRLDAARPSLQAAIEGARQALRRGIATSNVPGQHLTPLEAAARGTAVWSLVHGFAVLLLEGRLRAAIAGLPGDKGGDALLEAVLAVTHVGG